MTNLSFDIYSTLPEIYLTIAILVLLIYGVLLSVSQNWGYPLILSTTALLSIQVLFFTIILFLVFPYVNFFSWSYLLACNFYTLSSKIFIAFICSIWIIFSFIYIKKQQINSFEYWIFILITILSFFFIVESNDLLVMYLLIELQSLTFYILASSKRSSEFSTEAGLKYFVLGAFSSAFLLFGSSLVYGLTGITNFSDLTILFSGFILESSSITSGVFVGLLFILVALLFKLSSVPFHMWSPDVYEGSPTTTTAFFALFPKLIILTLLFRIFSVSFYDFYNFWKPFFFLSAFLSLLVGTLGALNQKKWKRFLAYSSINHVGFMLVGFLSGESFGMVSVLLYLFIYVITTLAIFSFVTDFRIYSYPQENQLRYVTDVKTLSDSNPLLAISLSIILFSMAGIPPLSGFFAKIFIIATGVQSGSYSLIIFSVIMSSVACFYYLRIIKSMHFLKGTTLPIINPMSKINSVVLGATCSFILLFSLDIELFSTLITRMVLSFTL